MSTWVQAVLAAAALVTAGGVLWKKLLHPMVRFVNEAEQILPLMRELTQVFRSTPNAFAVLDEIVGQFRTDSGSSLRDVVNRLEQAATENHTASELLKVGVETARQLSEQDRAQLERLLIQLDRMTVKIDAGAASNLRIEQAAEGVAEDLAKKRDA